MNVVSAVCGSKRLLSHSDPSFGLDEVLSICLFVNGRDEFATSGYERLGLRAGMADGRCEGCEGSKV